jgi:hypothetical protein
MPTARLALPLAALVLVPLGACGDSGGETAADTSVTSPTGVTGVTGASATSVTTSGASDSADASTGPGTTSNGSDSAATQPTTTTASDPTTGAASDGTSTGDIDPSTSIGSETTFASFGETTVGDPLCKQQIDIVFVMDVSTSMIDLLQKLEDEILTVDAKLKTLDVLPDVHYGLVVFVDDTLIINGGAPYADVQALKADFNTWWKFTQSNSQVNGGGFNGDWPENTIDALYTAAFGFQWRPFEDTLRMVIHCTDDTFGEKGANQSGVIIQHTYDETVLALQEREVRVFAFADNDMTGGPGNNQDVSMGFFTPYQGKTPIPDATDGGAFNINKVYTNELSLNAAINDSVEMSLCQQYIPM